MPLKLKLRFNSLNNKILQSSPKSLIINCTHHFNLCSPKNYFPCHVKFVKNVSLLVVIIGMNETVAFLLYFLSSDFVVPSRDGCSILHFPLAHSYLARDRSPPNLDEKSLLSFPKIKTIVGVSYLVQ